MTPVVPRRLRAGLALTALAVPALALCGPALSAAAAADAPTLVAWGETSAPAQLSGAEVSGIAAGLAHAVALTADGTVVAWGDDALGQTDVPTGLGDVTQVAAGANHTLALTADGEVVAWGNDSEGQTDVPDAATRVLQVAAGGSSSLAIAEDGSLVGWGDDAYGQNAIPEELVDVSSVDIAVGSGFSVALTSDGDVVVWGRSDVKQLDIPAGAGDATVVDIAAGTDQVVALTSDGEVVAWGGDDFGQATVAQPAAAQVAAAPEATADAQGAVAAGPYLSAALSPTGKATLWGKADDRLSAPEGGYAAIVAGERFALGISGDAPLGVNPGGAGNTPESLPAAPGDPGDGPGDGSGDGTEDGGASGTGDDDADEASALPFTGADALPALLIAVVLLCGGVTALVVARSRRAALAAASADETGGTRGAGRTVAALAIIGVAVGGSLVALPQDGAQAAEFPQPSLEQLVDNDFVLYFANAGAADVATVASGDHMGLYQSVTDQAYGADAATGASWGYVVDATSNPKANTSTGNSKTASVRYDAPSSGSVLETREVAYDFDLPDGTYEVTFGFLMPSGWTSRAVDLYAEGEVIDSVTASGSLLESTQTVRVTDGTLDLSVHSPAGRTNSYTDPTVNYIEIRAQKEYTTQLLAARISSVTLDDAQREGYAADSIEALDAAIAGAQALVDASSTDVDAIQGAYDALGEAYDALRPLYTYDSFRPGQAWVDDQGNPIQAHGGQVVPSTDADGRTIYYWYGEDRWNGYAQSRGVHAYSSYDLYNWTDEGLVLRSMSEESQFDDEYFSSLYADYTAEQKDAVFRDLDTIPDADGETAAILERPKVMYNASTDQWVLWVHADGPSETSTAQYAKARAGVAVSDSPTGPFRYVDSYRLNVAPEGEDNYQPGNPGMARDMNVFVDTDGTGYIIYSSEENYTMFLSKLSADYMYLSSSVDLAEPGVDFTRTYVGGHREAPAVFLYDGTYYLITSGATGWDPNPASYATADSLLGTWTDHGNPASGSGASTTYSSQSTAVLAVDAAKGEFIYMGDRWTPSDLRNAPVVWLPLEFGDDGSLILDWYDEWTLEDLEGKGKVAVDVDVPETAWLGDTSALPQTAEVTESGVTTTRALTWNDDALAVPGTTTVTASIEGSAKTISRTVTVVPHDARYIVDAGSEASPEFSSIVDVASTDGALENSAADQAYGADASTGASWGYTNAETGATSGSFGESLRYVAATAADRDLGYTFGGLEPGTYDVYVGLYDPWSQWADDRRADVSVNGDVVVSAAPITGEQTVATASAVSPDADGVLTVDLSPVGSGSGTDVQLSWIMVVAR